LVGLSWDQIPEAYVPLIIFALRSIDLTVATLRMFLVVQGKKPLAWVFGLFQSTSFILGIAGVLGNLTNPLNLLAYAAGFATGNVIGMSIETHLSPGKTLLKVISSTRGTQLTDTLREFGHGVTEVYGQGIEGTVDVLYCYVPRREVRVTRAEILSIDPDAFITAQRVRLLQGGWWA
jgi:uncharacterized protein YebE (UPF0316 family)